MLKGLRTLFTRRVLFNVEMNNSVDCELFLIQQQLQSMIADPGNYIAHDCDLNDTLVLCQLTHHHNGYIREKAVQCLGQKEDIAAIEELLLAANDWVKEVRLAATIALRHLKKDKNAAAFAVNLPMIRNLLQCQRYDHRAFVDEILRFLLTENSRPQLTCWLTCPDKKLSRAVLQTLIEYGYFNDESSLLLILDKPDVGLRMLAVTHWLRQQLPLNEAVLIRLLKDCWPCIRQATLFSLTDRAIEIPPELYSALLLDNNTLIRLRAKNMLNDVMDVAQFWRHVVTSTEYTPSQRRAALYGLDSIHDPNILKLAEWGLSQNVFPLRLAAMHILAKDNPDGDVKKTILSTLANPDATGLRLMVNICVWCRVPLTFEEIRQLQENAPSVKHACTYCRLYHSLNKWDGLILLLQSQHKLTEEFAGKQLAIWQRKFNLSDIQPNAPQRQQLQALFTCNPELHNKLWSYIPFL
ncbi:TPA: HEAT repeat domain-containing protein [Escherichia coli]|uniref:HEAT repeat domain-containing protein n=1 Tax=Escherichia coli TaxID=562 RepID=UPI001BE13061|nr:HEAT repeat domain-containing protein [Escherichia coli]WNK05790.1 HEAT repeat domain-containing protein [Escherichia coli]HAX5043088.1 HEAT repeat domain-containing protein [Escherichia coli]HAX5256544.1 HEAT repeat domain-containing protein [Escherichia coli]HAX5261857.1 HEAT repeat domain-containing protein [Escherichia coli]HBD4743393.1 HEAT repeat domain-containing protein [Escherichia coli]